MWQSTPPLANGLAACRWCGGAPWVPLGPVSACSSSLPVLSAPHVYAAAPPQHQSCPSACPRLPALCTGFLQQPLEPAIHWGNGPPHGQSSHCLAGARPAQQHVPGRGGAQWVHRLWTEVRLPVCFALLWAACGQCRAGVPALAACSCLASVPSAHLLAPPTPPSFPAPASLRCGSCPPPHPPYTRWLAA